MLDERNLLMQLKKINASCDANLRNLSRQIQIAGIHLCIVGGAELNPPAFPQGWQFERRTDTLTDS